MAPLVISSRALVSLTALLFLAGNVHADISSAASTVFNPELVKEVNQIYQDYRKKTTKSRSLSALSELVQTAFDKKTELQKSSFVKSCMDYYVSALKNAESAEGYIVSEKDRLAKLLADSNLSIDSKKIAEAQKKILAEVENVKSEISANPTSAETYGKASSSIADTASNVFWGLLGYKHSSHPPLTKLVSNAFTKAPPQQPGIAKRMMHKVFGSNEL